MVRINKVYTRAGDKGRTQLIGGDKVSKTNSRIECYGTIDELNAAIGMAAAALSGGAAEGALVGKLQRIQNELFNVGTQLATPSAERRGELPDITEAHIEALESEMDALGESLPELRSFVLPGGSVPSASLQIARTLCRRAERLAVGLAEETEVEARHLQYLNRLSDALFVFARYALAADSLPELLWEPEKV